MTWLDWTVLFLNLAMAVLNAYFGYAWLAMCNGMVAGAMFVICTLGIGARQ